MIFWLHLTSRKAMRQEAEIGEIYESFLKTNGLSPQNLGKAFEIPLALFFKSKIPDILKTLDYPNIKKQWESFPCQFGMYSPPHVQEELKAPIPESMAKFYGWFQSFYSGYL